MNIKYDLLLNTMDDDEYVEDYASMRRNELCIAESYDDELEFLISLLSDQHLHLE